MKTTVEIEDALLLRAKRSAHRSGRSLRALIEDGLRLALRAENAPVQRYELPDCSVGKAGAPDPLEAWSWQDLREEIYAESTRR